MKRILGVSGCMLIFLMSAGADDVKSKAAVRGNAPAGTPHASGDRDLGRARAEEVGQKKKIGLDHTKKTNHGKHKGRKAKS